ncbi:MULTISPECIES: hypothetical protein [unclassified Mesorhizobium]|uniref:hypothetical protein n=1 Tax=unclassified Mesorhizobium TaxID=325217 RepID=UPI00333DFAFE
MTLFVMLLFLQNLRATIPDDRRSGDCRHIRRARPCRLLDADNVCRSRHRVAELEVDEGLPLITAESKDRQRREMVFLPFPQPALEFSSQIKL